MEIDICCVVKRKIGKIRFQEKSFECIEMGHSAESFMGYIGLDDNVSVIVTERTKLHVLYHVLTAEQVP